MLLQLWLSCATTCYYGSGLVNYNRKTHTLSLVTGHGDLECFMGAEDKASNDVWEDLLERLRHTLSLPVLHLGEH